MSAGDPFEIIVEETDSGRRLDTYISAKRPHLTRNSAASLINNGEIVVSGCRKKASYKVKTGDTITGEIEEAEPPIPPPLPEPIPLHILFEDNYLIVIDKPAGMVVHPSPGHARNTLVNALLNYFPDIRHIGDESRSGIVHRLDKDTSGVMLVAKTEHVHRDISSFFKTRRHVQKRYLALVYGRMDETSGRIDLPLGRHPVDRKKISVNSNRPKDAETFWTVREEYKGLSLLELEIKTGRTHQIRVHCAATHHPVVGDTVYGSRKTLNRIKDKATRELIQGVKRQMLHAWKLLITHPETGKEMLFEAPIPGDMAKVIDGLRGVNEGGLNLPPDN